ncbi:MAG: hypothetical protein MZW92_18205 [Comamonadaceae bacterium]|nr:hypothetical protein [Comamonadaceae bacterium]
MSPFDDAQSPTRFRRVLDLRNRVLDPASDRVGSASRLDDAGDGRADVQHDRVARR